MSADASSLLAGLTESVSSYASTALQLGNEAAAGLATSFAHAVARVQAIPTEAAAAVDELTAAIGALLPAADDASSDAKYDANYAFPLGGAPFPTAPIAGAVCATADGQGGGFGETARVVPQVVPHRMRIDAPAFGRFIRLQHPHKPAESAAALTGIPVVSMVKMLSRESLPNGPNFLLCVIAYGPALIAAVLPEAEERWLIGAQILADQARLDAELARAQAARAANAERWTFCGISFGALV